MYMFINPFSSLGMGIYGAGYGFGSFAPIVPFDVFAPGVGLYQNIWRAGCSVGNIVGSWPSGFACGRYGAVSAYMDRLYSRIQARKGPDKENQRTPLPSGTDSPLYLERGRSYIREKLGLGKKLPEYNKVARNIYGPTPKDEESKARYKGWIDEDRTNDTILRSITESIVGDWIKDPKAGGQFARKWNMAMRAGDKDAAVRALLDPYGDGRYLGEIAKFVKGLSDKDGPDTIWLNITDHLINTIGIEAAFEMGDETLSVAAGKGIAGETPIANKESYISKIVDKGYLREEAEKIVEPLASEEEADDLVRNLSNEQQRTAPNLKEAKEKLKLLQEQKGKKEDIKQVEQSIAILEKQRAEQYLKDFMQYARWHYGKAKTDSFGYKAGELPKDVTDVPTAVKWVYGKVGINVEVPEKEEPKKVTSTGKGSGSKKTTKTLNYSEDDQYVLRAKGYTDKDMQVLQDHGMNEVDKIPDKKDFAMAAAHGRRFNNLEEVAHILGQFGGSSEGLSESDYLTSLKDPKTSVAEIIDLINQAAGYRNKSAPPAHP